MIVDGKLINGQQHAVGIMIQPFDVLCQLSQDWRTSIGVESDSVIMGGYWMKSRALPYDVEFEYTRIRLATRDEIIRFDAIKNVTELTATFYN